MSLTSPSVSYAALEETALALWNEWLGRWFDGAAHAIGGTSAVTFPSASLRFEQSALAQPLDGVGITVVMLSPGALSKKWEIINGARQDIAEAPVAFHCWVRASGKMPGTENAVWHCRRAADLLFAILSNSHSHHDLVQKGIMRLIPRPPEVVTENNHATRLLSVRAKLRFPILSQT